MLPPVIRNEASYYNVQIRTLAPGLTDIGFDAAVLLDTLYSAQWDSLAQRGALFDVHGTGTAEPVY